VTDDDLVPISVRLGNVVPPEDPEDWTRPLTWVAALGMLAGPILCLAWFAIGPPGQGVQAVLATYLVAATIAGGASATGATQLGLARAWTATLATGLFASLVVVILGVVMADERQVGTATPTLAHAVGAALGGLAGSAGAALAAAITARRAARPLRFVTALVTGVACATAAIAWLMPEAVKV
jgi:hypothetical protein